MWGDRYPTPSLPGLARGGWGLGPLTDTTTGNATLSPGRPGLHGVGREHAEAEVLIPDRVCGLGLGVRRLHLVPQAEHDVRVAAWGGGGWEKQQ